MKMLYFFILLSSFFISCKKEICNNSVSVVKNKELQNNENSKTKQDSLNVLSFEEVLSIKKLKTILKTDFFKRNFKLKINKYYESDSIYIYSIKILNDNLSNDFKKDYIVIDIKNKKTQYIIPLEINQIFNIDKKLMFGGIYNYREYDYYIIYKIEDYMISCELNTQDINGKTIIIGYYKDDECIDYSTDRFYFNYDEIKKEILFKGIMDNYCKEGVDRFENSVLSKRIESTIFFKYNDSKWVYENEKSNYYFW